MIRGKVTKGEVSKRLKEIGRDPEFADERDALTRCLGLMEKESETGRAVKDAVALLDEQVLRRYATLNCDEIKALVIEDKWFASIRTAIGGEVQQLTQRLATRVKELDERYADPLPKLEHDVEEYAAKVEEHLKRMGVAWE
jgi:type I restriction enzyme M protein